MPKKVHKIVGCGHSNLREERIRMEKKKKVEVKTPEDIGKLAEKEQKKWEIALELGYFDKIVEGGWKSLTSRESGRVGGILASGKRKKQVDNPEKVYYNQEKD